MSLDVTLVERNEFMENEFVYTNNITHNLVKMANKAGLYEYLWHPERFNIKSARLLIKPLTKGLRKLKMYPERYKKFNPENGWGKYEGLVKFVEEYLDACCYYPNAEISISR